MSFTTFSSGIVPHRTVTFFSPVRQNGTGHEVCVAYEDGYSLGYDDTKTEETLRMASKD